MKRARAIRLAFWFGLTPAALGCAQIAGLTGDYHLGSGGEGGAAGGAGHNGTGTSGRAGTNGGASASGDAGVGGDAGASGDANPGGGVAGASGGTVGTNGGAAGANGGAAGANGGTSGASGGAPGAGAGGAAVAGAGGGAATGPARIGFSEFHDSASGSDNASAHLANATFAKPAGTAAGDLILVFFGSDHELSNLSGNDLVAAGWTLLDQHEEYGTDGQATYLIYKFAGANEPDPIVFAGINNPGSGNGVQGLLSVYRGVNVLTPVNAYQVKVIPTGQSSISKVVTPTPAITTTVANCLLIAGLSPDSGVDAPVITTWPQGFGENQVSVINPVNPYPYGWANIYSAERHLPAAGTVAASEFDWDISHNDGYFGALSFVLALAP
jgi:hypothetical protein